MTTQTKTKTKATKVPQNLDEILQENILPPRVSLEQITQEFVDKAKKRRFSNNGANECYDDLLKVSKGIIEYYRDHVFSYNDFITLTIPLDLALSDEVLREYFNGWCVALQGAGRLTITESKNSCYGYSTFSFK
ncbi:MAG: hypothetical protein P4N60_12715 [Verrucomicrobiae bacterium]|nr:hypothetical protein [Verrucomicrobiae bacterium]